MSIEIKVKEFETELISALSINVFIKVSLGNYHGADAGLKKLYARKIQIKNTEVLSFTYRYKTKDIVKNFSIAEGTTLISNLLGSDFKIATLVTIDREFILEYNRKGQAILRTKTVNSRSLSEPGHDKRKKRLVATVDKRYLTDLKITDKDGNVFKNAQDKYRQINHYIEILDSLIKNFPEGEIERVVDMGSGKGYLTFALYDYLRNVLKMDVNVVGVEFRNDLVDLCNTIATDSGFDGLKFTQGTIDQYDQDHVDLLIALHACDTATDDAIYKGIKGNARLIVVAPCCHKQIRRQMEKSRASNDISFLTRHGIFLERQAEMITDGIRAMILEYFGYKTKVIEFVSDHHTPKNVMIVGIRTKRTNTLKRKEILLELNDIKDHFGISYHYLERQLMLGKE